MASVALSVVGAGIGALVGGPVGAKWGFVAGTMLAGVLFPPRALGQSHGKLDDLRVTGSGYGAMIPWVYGAGRVGGNILWSTNLREHSRELGGKGGVPVSGGREYWYTASMAVGICRGPITRVKKIWAEDRKIYDVDRSPVTTRDITIYTGTETQTADPLMAATLGATNTPAYRGLAYVVIEDLNLRKWGNRIPSFSFEVEGGLTATQVRHVLDDMAVQAGLEAADCDFAAATQSLTGMVVGQRTEAAELLEPLLRFYYTDLAEYDGKVRAVVRGGAADATLTTADLGAREWSGSDPGDADSLVTRRMQDLELPGALDLTYFEPGKQYDQGNQRGLRHTKGLVDEAVTVSTPLALDSTAARRGAERILYTQWLDASQAEFALGPKWIKLVPGSVLNVPVNGESVRYRVVAMDLGLFGEVRFLAVRDDAEVITQVVPGWSPASEYETPFDGIETTSFTAFSCPELRDEDATQPGFYVAATGGELWEGGTIYYSSDGGTEWIVGGGVTGRSAFGTCTTVLGDHADAATVDTVNTVTVDLVGNEVLESTSQAEVDAGTNAAVVGNEIIGFRTVTPGAATIYTLANLRRGRRDTPMTGHGASERFVHATHALVRVPVAPSLVGVTLLVKVVTEGQALSDVSPVSVTICNPDAPYVTTGAKYDFSLDTNSMYLPLCL